VIIALLVAEVVAVLVGCIEFQFVVNINFPGIRSKTTAAPKKTR
jgi:hypothetical protein